MAAVKHWDPPTLFAGLPVAVLASGPSMSQEVADKVHRSGMAAIVVNDTYRLAPWADVLYAMDYSWWARHPAAHEFGGIRATVEHEYKDYPAELAAKGVQVIKKYRGDTLPSWDSLATGSSSGYGAAQLAWLMGASHVLLVGLDGKLDLKKPPHWFGYHAHEPEWFRSPYPRFRDEWAAWAPTVEPFGMRLVNVTPDGALSDVPGIENWDLDDALAAFATAPDDFDPLSDPPSELLD